VAFGLLGILSRSSGEDALALDSRDAGCDSLTLLQSHFNARISERQPHITAKGQKALELRAAAQKRLNARGYYLGCTLDFWIVLTLVVTGLVFAVLLSTCTTNVATKWRAEYVPFSMPASKPEFPRDFMCREVFGNMREDHARMADIAFRKALVCSFVALTYFVSGLGVLNEQGWAMKDVAFTIVLSVGLDLGSTASGCWNNFYGTLIATLHVLFMFDWYPNGVLEIYDSAWYFGVIDFVVFCSVFLILNWDNGTRLFALSKQVVYTASFLNPNSLDIYSAGIDDLDMKSPDAGPFVGSIIGWLLALVIIGPR